MKRSIFTIVLLVSVVTAFQAEARRGKHHREILESLDLTDDQKSELEKVRANQDPGRKALRGEQKTIRKRMGKAFVGDSPDSELRDIHKEMQGVRNRMGDQRFEKMLSIRRVLNKKQRKKFQKKRKEYWKKRRGRRSNDDR